uniref:ARAD1D30668p n=1 Tax=Blastobotrys adeninivorans TaxID=409370 RepID=A0A060TBD6_BLAAD
MDYWSELYRLQLLRDNLEMLQQERVHTIRRRQAADRVDPLDIGQLRFLDDCIRKLGDDIKVIHEDISTSSHKITEWTFLCQQAGHRKPWVDQQGRA